MVHCEGAAKQALMSRAVKPFVLTGEEVMAHL